MSTAQHRLCLGFSLMTTSKAVRKEIKFAITDCGTVFQTPPKPFSHTFNTYDWMETKFKPRDIADLGADYIGMYEVALPLTKERTA